MTGNAIAVPNESDSVEQQEPTERTESCPKHGEFTARPYRRWRDTRGCSEWRWSECPKCEEEKQQAEEARRAQRCRGDWERHVAFCLANAGIPARFNGKTLDTFQVETKEQRVALELCLQYVTEAKANVAGG